MTSTREHFIEVAAGLFLRNGYEATGVAEILREVGVGAGSFYYHFGSKENLLLAVLDNYARLLPVIFEEPARSQVQDPIERVFFVLGIYRTYLVDSGFELGCPIGNVALEVGNSLPEVRARTAELFARWRGMIHQMLEEGRDRLPSDLNLEGLASLVLTVVEGAIMQSRSERSIRPFDASVRQLRDYFQRLGALR